MFIAPSMLMAQDIKMDQNTLCTTSSMKVNENSEKCSIGQKIAFLPKTFGSEQLPIMFIAGHCDLNYNVSLTSGGVVCVFNPVTKIVE